MHEKNYSIGDAIEFTKSLTGKGILGIATSPPYNKAFAGRGLNPNRSSWKNSALMEGNYSHYNDDLPNDDYITWQRDFLAAAIECVGDNGVVLYNIGRRFHKLAEDSRQEIIRGFPLRQTIIWNRGGTINHGGKRPSMLPPIYELIYVFAGKNWRLPEQYLKEFRTWGDVWRMDPARNNKHPAPFPLFLAIRLAKLINGPLADPFAGSGTMGLAAITIKQAYYLNDLSPEYKQMFLERVKNFRRMWI